MSNRSLLHHTEKVMKKRNIGIIVAAFLVVIIAIVARIYMDKINNEKIAKELTDKTTLFCNALDNKDINAVKSIHSKEYIDTIEENYFLGLIPEKYLPDGTDVNINKFYCKQIDILSEKFLEDLDVNRARMEEKGEYVIQVIVEFGIKGEMEFRQKWNIVFIKEHNEFKINDVGTIANTLSEIKLQ